MTGIPIYAAGETDFSNNGLGLLLPLECEVEESANGQYMLRLVHPIADDLRWTLIGNGCIVKAAVPVRESPLYEFTASATAQTTVTRKVYKVKTNGGRLNLRQKPTASSRSIAKYKPGTEVIRLADNGNGWYQVTVLNGGATGYMYAQYLTYVRDYTETITSVQPGTTGEGVLVQPAREQLFRIHRVEPDTERGIVTAEAMHIFYDLRGNIVNGKYAPEAVAGNTVASELFAKALNPHDFELYAASGLGKVTGEYSYRSLVESLLDPDEGVVAQANALLVRDNYDVFLMPDEVRDMGVTIRRGKNLLGVTATHDASGIVTRIVPVGRDKEGEPLYLDGTGYVDSERIGDYPIIYSQKVEYDVSIVDKKDANADEGKFATAAEARAKLRELAAADFAAGCDLPSYTLDVDFVMLGNTAEYARYAALQSVHLFDTVSVIDESIGLDAKIRMTAYKWDVLAQKYTAVTLGQLQGITQTIYSYNLPNGGISGTKLAPGSVGSVVLRDAVIRYAHITAAAIEQLSANAITALTARIGEITADKIITDELYTAYADMIRLAADSISAGQIDADRLAANLAEIVNLSVQTGQFDMATIKQLLANALILQDGVAGSMMITNLAITSANMLNATIGELVLKGDDGGYYRVFVGADGVIHTEVATVTDGEIAAGQTSAGNQIVETTANIGALNAQDIKAQTAIIASIFTEALTAGKITAAEAMLASATIPALYVDTIKAIGDTIDISANSSITLGVGGAGLSKLLRLDERGVHVGVYGSGNELLLDEMSVNVMMNNQRYSRFAANYVQFGNYQLRKSADGGLVFKLKEG